MAREPRWRGLLTPRPLDDLTGRFAVDLVGREDAESGGTLMHGVDVVDREEQGLRSQRGFQPAVRDVEDGEDDAAAGEVVALPHGSLPKSSQVTDRRRTRSTRYTITSAIRIDSNLAGLLDGFDRGTHRRRRRPA